MSNQSVMAGIPMGSWTYEDFDVMFKALDALDSKASSDSMTGMLLGTMLSPDKESADRVMGDLEKRERAKDHERRALREKTAILRAKLILVRRDLDSVEADRLLEESQN